MTLNKMETVFFKKKIGLPKLFSQSCFDAFRPERLSFQKATFNKGADEDNENTRSLSESGVLKCLRENNLDLEVQQTLAKFFFSS